MNYLLDTNVISETLKPQPELSVIDWMNQRQGVTLYLSVLTLGEIRKGIETVKSKAQKHRYQDWLEGELSVYFTGRILPIDREVAECWGRLMAQAKRPLPSIDSLLAATAVSNQMTLVTRNTKDFAGLPVSVFNPWKA
mgnify:FL=1